MGKNEPTREAVRDCAIWLHACLELGWRKSDLDFLELLWWKYHDHTGQLMPDKRAIDERISGWVLIILGMLTTLGWAALALADGR